jgi:Flp pilus assembly protein TadG
MARVAFRSAGRVRRLGHADDAAVLAEFALVVPVLLMLVVGMITSGMVLNRQLSMSYASREAARYGATLPSDQCEPVSACGGLTWAEVVRSVAVQRGGDGVTTSSVCAALVSGPGTAPVALTAAHTTAGGTQPCYVDGSADTGLRVQVAVRRSDSIELIVASLPLIVGAKATARAEA